MSDEFFERRVGTVLHGKWTLEKLLGVGGMAAVYAGRHHIGHRDAIKILHPSVARSKEMRARFEQEARAVSRLGHPGAVRVDDIDTAEDGSLYLVMELLEGESLAGRLQRGSATAEEALRWTDELLDVLGAAHALGIVHRDVKPDNVFILTTGRVKLLDFGIARMRDADSLKTATGTALGTLPYMAPEQVRGEDVDARVDLFAVGATLVRALGRRPIHEAGSEAELYLKMGMQPAPPARGLLPSAPEAVWPVIDHALAFDRARRYPDAAAMRSDIQALRGGLPPSHGVAAARLEPTVAGPGHGGAASGAETARVPSVAVAATSAAHTARPSPRPRPQADSPAVAAVSGAPLSRRLVGVLGASLVAGIALTALVLWLFARGDTPEPDPASAPWPGVGPGGPEPGQPVPGQQTPGQFTPGRVPAGQPSPPGRGAPPKESKSAKESRKREEKAREAQRKRDEKAREEQRKREEKARDGKDEDDD